MGILFSIFIMKSLIAIFLIINVSFSQSSILVGTIKDSSDKKPLVGANVFLKETSLGTATLESGNYKITNINPGAYILKVTYIGYESKEIKINFTPGKIIKQDFELSYKSIQGEKIEVTAQAKGQMDAINKQLKSKSIKNIISSDKIQELPDANAAEAVARVPGVSIKRKSGEGNKVVIRGLSPKYNKITVNGVNLASTDSDDRSTDISMISQYMLEEIEVIKAGTPDLEADVLGGTVNFKLKNAKPGFHGNLILQNIHNNLEKTQDDFKVILGGSNRFFKNKLGGLIEFDFESRNRSSHNLSASYQNMPAYLNSINPLKINYLALKHNIRQNDRINNLYVIDYQLENGLISYSGLHSTIKKNAIPYTNAYSLTNFTSIERRTGEQKNTLSVVNEIWKYENNFTPNLRIDIFKTFAMSKNGDTAKVFNFTQENAYTTDVTRKNLDVIQDFTINDTNAIFFSNYEYNEYKSKETEKTYGGNVEFLFNISNQISGSFKIGYKNRKKSRNFDYDTEAASFVDNNPIAQTMRDSVINSFDWLNDISSGTIRIPYPYIMDNEYSDSNFLDGQFNLGPVADIDKMNQIFSFIRKNFSKARYPRDIIHSYNATGSLIFDYTGTENYNAYYFMVDANLGSKFNLVTGIRYEKNRTIYQSYHGMRSLNSAFSTAGSDTVYYHTRENAFALPSIFLKYKPLDWISIRFAKTKTITRPDYSSMIPLYNINGLERSVIYRNPFLEPGLSDNYDYIVSFMNNYLGLVSLNYFTKNISGLIFDSGRRVITDPKEYALPGYTEWYIIPSYKTNNPNDVIINGFEIDYQTRFWYLPKRLRGLVFSINYTRTYSKVKYPRTIIDHDIVFEPFLQVTVANLDTFYVDRMIDQPRDIINYSIGYDYEGFSARFSMNYISNVFSRTNFWPEMRQDTDGYKRYDFSLKQKLPIDGLELYFNVSNIFDAVDINRMRGFNLYDPNLGQSYYEFLTSKMENNESVLIILDEIPRENRPKSLEQHYGKSIDLGFRFSF